MAKDERLYARFDIAMDEHPKVMLLSDAAFRTLFEVTFYSRRQLTDGFLANGVVSRKWAAEAIAELASNDPEKPSLYPFEKAGVAGYMIHDYEKHQTTTADIEAKRDAGRKGGLAKAKQNASKPVAPASDVPLAESKQTPSAPLAITETETETKTKTKTKTPSKTSSSEVAIAPIRPDVLMLIERLDMRIAANGGKVPTRTKKNTDAARLLLERDGCTFDQVSAAIDWATNDEFWRTNILSMSKLREKYEQLRLAATRAPRKQGAAPVAKADQNAALFYELYGGGNERTGSVQAIDAG